MTGIFGLSVGQMKKAKFRENGICVDGTKVTVRHVLKEGEELVVLIEDKNQGSSHLIPIRGEVSVLYEDEDVICVHKPAGVVCHPSAGHYADSMANLMVGYFLERGEGFTVRLLGRLDKDTSGLLLYAKHAPALTRLEGQRDENALHKTYYAILSGCPDWSEKTITKPIYTACDMPLKMACGEEGMEAITHAEILWKNEEKKLSLARVTIETGRTHQIRVHMAFEGFPLVGDLMYGNDDRLPRHALHAESISFLRLSDGERVTVKSPFPSDLVGFLLQNGCNCIPPYGLS